MSDYTPGLDEVREMYGAGTSGCATKYSNAAFDRAIEQVRADAKREAWDEGVKAEADADCENPRCGACDGCDTILVNPYEEEV